MDDHTITKKETMRMQDAVVALMGTYFVYGVAYPKKLRNSLILIENVLLNITESKVPVTVMRVKNGLSK